MQCPGGRGQLLTPGGGARTESAMRAARLELHLLLSAQQAEIFQLSEHNGRRQSKPSQPVLCSIPLSKKRHLQILFQYYLFFLLDMDPQRSLSASTECL